MSSYTKEIKISMVGLVHAQVTDDKGRRVGSKFFSTFFNTNAATERAAERAHKWADNFIKVCERQEYINE